MSATSAPKKKLCFLGLLSTILLLGTAAGNLSCHRADGARILHTPIRVTDRQGNARHYRLFLPSAQDRQLPLLVFFHAVQSPEFASKVPSLRSYTGSPVEETGLIEFCRSRQIALLVPDAFYSYVFLGCPAKGWVVESEMNGVEKMIDEVIGRFPIAKEKIFLAGISAGAVFCHFLANHRPDLYAAILSHSQGYMDRDNRPLSPDRPGPVFGVLFAYTRGDYPQMKQFCLQSEERYRQAGYRTHLLADLPPDSHRWADTHDAHFWKWLNKLAKIPPATLGEQFPRTNAASKITGTVWSYFY